MTKSYSMYTPEGDAIVAKLVEVAKAANLSWADTYSLMYAMSKTKCSDVEGIMDTAVREVIYSEVAGEDEEFYV